MKRLALKGFILVFALTLVLSGCGGNSKTESSEQQQSNDTTSSSAPSGDKVTLKMAMWDSNNAFIEYLTNKVKEYSTVEPNVKIELESFKSDGDYLQAMKVRLSGNELPDVMELKPAWLIDFKDELVPLDGEAFLAKNKYVDKFKVEGKTLAVPTVMFPEVVYYHPSIFKELGLQVPTTWPQFMDVMKKIKDNGKYIPYAMGGKDSWPDYPFNEFMPQSVSDNENYLSDMAKQDKPFGQGTPFYTAYKKIDEMYKANVMGPDPLGVSWDQATNLFYTNKAAIIAAGLWFLPGYQSTVGNTDDLAAFPMPYRDSEDQPLKLMTFTDHFYGISQASKHQDAAKKFLAWFYSPEVYQTYLDAAQLGSTFDGVTANIPWLNTFYETYKDVKPFTYLTGDAEYTKLFNQTQLDVKAIGQDMMAGKDLDKIVKELDDKWSKAKGK